MQISSIQMKKKVRDANKSAWQEMLNTPRLVSKARAFDLVLNLGVHAHLLEPSAQDDSSAIEEDYSLEPSLDNGVPLPAQEKEQTDQLNKLGNSSAVDKFECWILGILSEVLLHLVQVHVYDLVDLDVQITPLSIHR